MLLAKLVSYIHLYIAVPSSTPSSSISFVYSATLHPTCMDDVHYTQHKSVGHLTCQ